MQHGYAGHVGRASVRWAGIYCLSLSEETEQFSKNKGNFIIAALSSWGEQIVAQMHDGDDEQRN